MFRPGLTGQDSMQSGGMAFDWSSVASLAPFAIAGAGLVSAGLGYAGATSAADTQAAAATHAADLSQGNLATTRADLAPFRAAGVNALTDLTSRLPALTSPITMDQATLEATPGYQFTRDQGLKSVQSAAAAKGLGISGAALKGAANYATGLADNTYQNRFANELASRQNAYNDLAGVVSTGENAAAQTGNFGLGSTNAINASNLAGANAAAAGTVGGTNAVSNALTGGVNNYLQYALLTKLLGGGGGGTSSVYNSSGLPNNSNPLSDGAF